MNKAEVISAVEMFKDAFKLINEANELLMKNGIDLCGVNPKFEHQRKNEVQVYSGIDKFAEAYNAGIVVDKYGNYDKWFAVNNVKYFEIAQPDGTYR